MLSTKIKEATKAAHQDLEIKVVKKLKAIRSNKDYAELLRFFYAYFNHVEKAIDRFITPAVLPDYKDRRNSAYLKNDIEALGGNTNNLPVTTVPDIHMTLQALGALYVMEGSIMGGPIIVQMLSKAGIHEGLSFFSGYGADTGQKWGAFVSILNQQANNEQDEALVIDAANATFNHFGEVFQKVEAAHAQSSIE
jgi:heme oxygenase